MIPRGLGLKPRLDHLVLRKDMREIGNKILDDAHIRQRVDRRRRAQVGNEPRASEPVRAVRIHGAGTADALPARAAEGECRIHLVFDPEESVQNHRAAIVEIDFEGIEARVIAGIRLVAINLK